MFFLIHRLVHQTLILFKEPNTAKFVKSGIIK
jgi:hypothetical protein